MLYVQHKKKINCVNNRRCPFDVIAVISKCCRKNPKKNSVCLVVVLFLNRLCYEFKLDKIPREFQKKNQISQDKLSSKIYPDEMEIYPDVYNLYFCEPRFT